MRALIPFTGFRRPRVRKIFENQSFCFLVDHLPFNGLSRYGVMKDGDNNHLNLRIMIIS